jgi:hypothetical protein
MAKAFVDTTILADALLKKGDSGVAARRALQRYDKTELPVYAIKELKAGTMRNMAWFHDKLVSTGSFIKALDALHKMSLSPRRYTTSTAIEALREAAQAVGKLTTQQMVELYGPTATQDAVQCDRYRLAIKTNIIIAWKRRRRIVSEVVHALPCYQEVEPYEERGLLIVEPTKCDATAACALARALKADQNALVRLKAAVDAQPSKPENQRRSQALRALIRTPKRDFPHKMCRALGDAAFAFLAPPDSTILTTNTRDLRPLAQALGKTVDQP